LDRRRWQELRQWKIWELQDLRAECKRAVKEIESIWEKTLKKGGKDIYRMEYDFILFES
jgi:hypothetical protein